MNKLLYCGATLASALYLAAPAYAQTATPDQLADAQHDALRPAAAAPEGSDHVGLGNGGSTFSADQPTKLPERTHKKPLRVPAEPSPFPQEAMGFYPAGPYYFSRWHEDWSFLRDKSKRSDPFDPLKFIPFDADGTIYLTLSSEERFRINDTRFPGLVRGAKNQQQLLGREVAGADLHLGDHLRVYGEVLAGQLGGKNFGAINPIQRNGPDISQLFVDAKTDALGGQFGVRFGRQQYEDGPENIVHIHPAANVYVEYDGIRAWANFPRFRVDAFHFFQTKFTVGSFNDPRDRGNLFEGVQTSFRLPEFSTGLGQATTYFDPLFYHIRVDKKVWGGKTGREQRYFAGGRYWGKAGPLDFTWTGIYQYGTFNGRPISAYAVFTEQGIELSEHGLKPKIGFHADMGSGGGAFGNGTLHDFNFYQGDTPYFSWENIVGQPNLLDFAPMASFVPLRAVTVSTEFEWLHRLNQHDAVYSGLQAPYARTQTVPGHDVGRILRGKIAWAVNRHVTVTGIADYVFAGDVWKRAGYRNTTFWGGNIDFRF